MKIKVVFISIILIFALTVSAMADIQFTYEPVESVKYGINSWICPTLLQIANDTDSDFYEFMFNGKTYAAVDMSTLTGYPFPVPAELESFGADVIKAGEYYMTRPIGKDNYWYFEALKDNPKFYPIRFYNLNIELVHEQIFEGFPMAIGYFDGTYYCKLYCVKELGSYPYIETTLKTVKSTDMVNWTETEDMNTPRPMDGYTFTHSQYSYGYEKPMTSIKNAELSEVVYENSRDLAVCYTLGNWVVKWDKTFAGRNELLLSNDNVYFTKVTSPKNLGNSTIRLMYEYDGELIVELAWTYDSAGRLRTPIQYVYDAMKKIEDPVYVKLNDKILGFEQPPVIENGRTLVPMRFLFEQMGADVEWDEATQTAIATQDNNSVEFGINCLSATVNEETVEMDAAPQLIGDKTYVPLRFLSENLGYTVDWSDELKMATITTGN